METTTIRVPVHTRKLIGQIAKAQGTSMQSIIEQANESYRRQNLLHEANAASAALRSDAEAWEDFENELSVWDAALGDGVAE